MPAGKAAKAAVAKSDKKVPVEKLDAYVLGRSYEIPDDVVTSNAADFEDEFEGLYTGSLLKGASFIEPPYNPQQLEWLVENNNALAPCIDTMVQNVDGTGYCVEPKDKPAEYDGDTDQTAKDLQTFFDEPWPHQSFLALRKVLRRDIETTGNGYMEVIRNKMGEMTFLRRLDPKMMRLVLLDVPRIVTITVQRNGKDLVLRYMDRPRRYVQKIANKYVYFKQYGSQVDVDRISGEFADGTIEFKKKASEVVHFTKVPHHKTAYGIPVWVAQTPSVLGSRRAEEYNLKFFDQGGVPPVMIFVHGGSLSDEARASLEGFLNSRSADQKQNVAVVEAAPTSGAIDGPNQVRVTVERFGAERQNDSMFEKYDANCESRVRRSWRLPPLFVGLTSDYTFATAYASYMVAEAQTFKPEREAFDEIVNRTIMKELDPSGEYVFRSHELHVRDMDHQLTGYTLAKGAVDNATWVAGLNELVGMKLTPKTEAQLAEEKLQASGIDPSLGMPFGQDAQMSHEAELSAASPMTKSMQKIMKRLHAGSYPLALADSAFDAYVQKDSKALMQLVVKAQALPASGLLAFRTALTQRLYAGAFDDSASAQSMAGAALLSTLLAA